MSAVFVTVLGAGLYAMAVGRRQRPGEHTSTRRALLGIVALVLVSLLLLTGAQLFSTQLVGHSLQLNTLASATRTPEELMLSVAFGVVLGIAEALAISFLFTSIASAWQALRAAGFFRRSTLPTDMSTWLAAVSRAWQPTLVHPAESGPRWAVLPILAIALSLQELLFREIVPFYLSGLHPCAAVVTTVGMFCLVQCAGARSMVEMVYPLIFGLVVGATHLALVITGVSVIPLMVAVTVAVTYTTMI